MEKYRNDPEGLRDMARTPSRTYTLTVLAGGIAVGLLLGYFWCYQSITTHPDNWIKTLEEGR